MQKISLIQAMHIAEINRQRGGYAVSETLFNSNTIVEAKKAQIEVNYGLLEDNISGKLVDGSGNEGQKTFLKDTVIETLGNMARGCGVYFEDGVSLDTAAALNRPKSYYDRLKQEEIVTVLTNTRDILFANKVALAPYGTTTGWFTLVDGQIAALAAVIPVIGDAHEATGAANINVDKYIGLIDGGFIQLDRLIINAFLVSNRDEVDAYLLTRGENIIGKHHNNVDCSMKNSVGGAGINNGLIIFTDPATGVEVKRIKMDAYGLGECIMRMADFYASASAEGFISQANVVFRPVYRGTFHLDFLMVPITAAMKAAAKAEAEKEAVTKAAAEELAAAEVKKDDKPSEPTV